MDLRKKLRELQLGCSNGNCIWRRPRGLHTNSSCRCVKNEFDESEWWEALNTEERRELDKRRRNVRYGIQLMRDYIEELEGILNKQEQ